VRINLPGHHNVMNALAAIAVATEEGIDDAAILTGLNAFAGVGRRFQVSETVTVDDMPVALVDDYGHHPTEVEAVIQTAREVWPERRLAMVYQPHRYSRTQDLFDDFVRVLSAVDALLLLDVYAAGESRIDGADSKALAQAIRQRGQLSPIYAKDANEAFDLLPNFVAAEDVLLVQGAGNVNIISNRLTGDDD
jgi:UDP-N-acetylmuramate--alanine ligase